jgi:hypothetical protein
MSTHTRNLGAPMVNSLMLNTYLNDCCDTRLETCCLKCSHQYKPWQWILILSIL